jgi:thiamine kinase-like enzyme
MLRSTLETLALRWVPGDGAVEIRPLASGLVNESYCVTRAGARYGLRLVAGDAQGLGVNRSWECRVLAAAAAAGVAPAVLHCEPLHGVLVTDWVSGLTWTAEETSRSAAVAAMAALLRRVHSLTIPAPARVMNPAAWIARYEKVLAREISGPPATRPWVELSDIRERQLALLAEAEPPKPVICHSDLHRHNLVVRDGEFGDETGARAILLDWEYAHVADPLWDLAGWASNNDWRADEAQQLAWHYLGRAPAAGERVRLDALLWLYDYVCLLWSELYLRWRAGPEPSQVPVPVQAVAAREEYLLRRLRLVR